MNDDELIFQAALATRIDRLLKVRSELTPVEEVTLLSLPKVARAIDSIKLLFAEDDSA